MTKTQRRVNADQLVAGSKASPDSYDEWVVIEIDSDKVRWVCLYSTVVGFISTRLAFHVCRNQGINHQGTKPPKWKVLVGVKGQVKR